MIQNKSGAQKHLNFLEYALRSLTVYRTRTIAVVFSLTMAISVLGSIVFISDGLSREALIAANAAPDITVQGMIAGRITPIATTMIPDFERIPGVERVVPRMWGYVVYNTRIFTVMGLDPISSGLGVPGLLLESGRFPNEGEAGEAVIGSYLAEAENLELNSTLPLEAMSEGISGGMGGGEPFNSNFTVVGIFSSDVSLYTSDMILMNYLDAQSLLLQFRIYSATDLCIYLTDSSSANTVATSIAQLYPELRILTRNSIVDATSTTYGLRGGFATIMWLMPLITVVLIAWSQANTVGQDSRREVGILKTLGFSTSDIMEIRLIEAVVLGFISASLGVFVAIVYDAYIGAPFLREFLLGWTATLPFFKLPIEIGFDRLLTLYAIAVFPLLLGSLVPAWLSAITEPDTVLRGS